MSDLRLVLVQARYGMLSFLRNPRALIFTIVFPVFFLVIFAGIFGGEGKESFGGGRISTDAYFTAGIIAYSIMLTCFSTLAISLTTQRESGQLKRYRGTPIPSWTFVAALILRSIVLTALMTAVLLALGKVAFDVGVPSEGFVGLLVYVLLGTATMCVLGIALTAVTPTADAASTIAPFAAIVLSFISGVFIPVDQLPGWLEEVGRVFPLAHLAEGLQTTFATKSGTGIDGADVAVLGIWTVAGLLVAARGFRWEPQAVRG